MDIVSICPLRGGSLVWQQGHSAWVVTVVCKGTFELLPGESTLFHEQEYPNEEDNFWNDDSERSLYSPNDLPPFKPRADVTLVGYAYAPQGKPVRSLVTRLIVGEIDKSIEVFGERSWTHDGVLREGPRFTKMPLRYERAAGGPETTNPVGLRYDAAPDIYGAVPIPNLQPTGMLLTSPTEFIDPIGYGPVAPSWPGRIDKLGPHAGSWTPARLQRDPMPPEIDPGFFNSAPRDQQTTSLRENERIVLENLHPQHARLVTSLPGVRPRAFFDRNGQDITMTCDTLWIDTDRGLCTLVWRGRMAVESPRQAGRIILAMEAPGQRVSWSDVERLSRPSNEEEGTAMIDLVTSDTAPEPDPSMLPGRGALAGLSAPKPTTAPPGKPPPLPERRPGAPRKRPNTMVTAVGPAQVSPALPFLQSASPAAPPPPPSSEARSTPLPGDASPAWLTAAAPPAAPPTSSPIPSAPKPPDAPPPVAPLRADSPWAGGGSGIAGPPPAPKPVVSSSASMDALRSSLAAAPPVSPKSAPAAPSPPAQVDTSSSSSSAIAASNAAAAASASPSWATPPPATDAPQAPVARARVSYISDVIELLWFDPESVPTMRETERFQPIIEAIEPKETEPEFDAFDDKPAEEVPEPARSRKLVFGVLTRADQTDSEGVNEAIGDAVTDEGTFTPPLIVIAGDLHFPFDELETLKATVTAVTPLISGDKKLKDTVDTVNELLKTPWLESSTGVAEGQTARLKEAYAQSPNRMLSASYLDTHTERILMEQRNYQKRTVFGEVWIRCLLVPASGANPIPTYLPESLSKKLPMFQVFKVRLIAEAHVQQDQYEAHPSALRVVALGRVIATPQRGRSLPKPFLPGKS